MKHFLNTADWSRPELQAMIDEARRLKASPHGDALKGKTVALLFLNNSLRTRTSFDVGARQLGGHAVVLSPSGGMWPLEFEDGVVMDGEAEEHVKEAAKVLSRFVHGIVIRTYGQDQVDGLAEHGSIPVINALTDLYHPCQGLADLLTIKEKFGDLKGKKLVYVGAGNNVAHTLLLAGPLSGMDVTCLSPKELPPNAFVVDAARRNAAEAGTKVVVDDNIERAIEGADVIYGDTWVSMGEEEEAKRLLQILDGFQVNDEFMAKTGKKESIFMHCLPAHRGQEVTEDIIDGDHSIVFDQAENRLHVQKAILIYLLEKNGSES